MGKVNLEVRLGKLKLRSPVLPASGTFDIHCTLLSEEQLNRLGALVPKSVRPFPREGNPPPRTCETACGMINSIGTPSKGIDYFVEHDLPLLTKYKTPLIVSIQGRGAEEYRLLAEKLNGVPGIDAVEIDLSCPNMNEVIIATSEGLTEETVEVVKSVLDKPVIAKLSANVTDITLIAKAAQRGGVDIISLINSIKAMAIDIETQRPVLGNKVGGLSGPAIKPIALKMVWDVAQAVNLPVIGIGGISSWQDAIEFMLAGASAVAVGTAALVDPFVMLEIIKGVEEYLEEHGYGSPAEIVGLAFKK
jgi:dihydroorotate dehydrogenase (NAD+) catalytic subunit